MTLDAHAAAPELEPAAAPAAAPEHSRRLFGRDMIYVVLSSVQLLITSVMSPVLAHLLRSDAFGVLSSALAIYQFLVVLGTVGLDQVVVIFHADPRHGTASARRVIAVATLYAMVLCVSVWSLGPLWIHALGLHSFGGPIAVAVLWCGPGAANTVAMSYLRALDRLVAFGVLSMITGVGGQLLGLALALNTPDHSPTAYAWGGVITQVVALGLTFTLARPLVPRRRADWAVSAGAFRFGMPLAVTGLAMYALNAGDRVLVQRYLGETAVARYQVAYIVGSAIMILLAVLTQTWLPRMLAVGEDERRWAVIQSSLVSLQRVVGPLIVAVACVAPIVLAIVAPPSYHTDTLGYVVLYVALAAVPFADVGLGAQQLIAVRRSRDVAVATVTAAVLNIVLNIVMVPRLGLVGAGLATVIGYTVQAGMQRGYLRRSGHRRPLSLPYAVTITASVLGAWAATAAPLGGLWSVGRVVAGGLIAAYAGLRLYRAWSGPAAAAPDAGSPRARTAPAPTAAVRRLVTPSRVVTVVAIALWLTSLGSLRAAHADDLGLLAAASPLFAVAAAATVVALLLALRARRPVDAALALGAWLLVARASTALAAPLPTGAWTYRHLGAIDTVLRTGRVPAVGGGTTAVPGVDGVLARFCSVTGLTPSTLAHWFPFAVHVAVALAVVALALALRLPPLAAVTAACVTEVVTWTGQDRLSPQPVAFVLALAALALLLRAGRRSAWLGVPAAVLAGLAHQPIGTWLVVAVTLLALAGQVRRRVATVLVLGTVAAMVATAAAGAPFGWSGLDPVDGIVTALGRGGSGGERLTTALSALVLVATWGGAGVAAVAAVRRRRRRAAHVQAARAQVADTLHRIGELLRSGSYDGTALSALEHRVRVAEARVAGAGDPARRGQHLVAASLVSLAALAVVVGRPVDRTTLWSLFACTVPGLALVLAPALARLMRPAGTDRPARVPPTAAITGVAALVVAVASLQATYGPWFTQLVSRPALDETRALTAELPAGSRLLGLTPGLPQRPTARSAAFAARHARFDTSVARLPGLQPRQAGAAEIVRVTERLAARSPGFVYLTITPQMRAYSSYHALFRPGVLDAVVRTLTGDGNWLVVRHDAALTVLRYSGPRS